MPVYAAQCEECGWEEDDFFVPLQDYDVLGVRCPECGEWAKRIILPVATIGPMPSKPLVVDQVGRTFDSSKQLREYMDQNPNAKVLSKNDSEWKAHKDWARNKCEARAKARGYDDHADYKRRTKAESERKKTLESG